MRRFSSKCRWCRWIQLLIWWLQSQRDKGRGWCLTVLFKGTYAMTHGHPLGTTSYQYHPVRLSLYHITVRDTIQIMAVVNYGHRASLLTFWKDGMTWGATLAVPGGHGFLYNWMAWERCSTWHMSPFILLIPCAHCGVHTSQRWGVVSSPTGQVGLYVNGASPRRCPSWESLNSPPGLSAP